MQEGLYFKDKSLAFKSRLYEANIKAGFVPMIAHEYD